MDLRLRDKTALVTGASGGIGGATARLLAAEGADVVVCYHQNHAGAARTAERVQAAGRAAWLCGMDVADSQAVNSGIAGLPAEARCLDIVILCAGEAPVDDFEKVTPEGWRRTVDLNLNGAFHVLHAVQPLLVDGAAIVTVASVAGSTGVPHQAPYAAAKAGLINLTKSAARALAPRVRVNCVAPGMTLTEMGQRTATGLPADYARQKLLVQRFAEPDEIARCIVFLASPAASFVTGATWDVNGGRDLR
jgi:3-oxoacyl-[acyl-carrier protein] reductase